MRCPRTVNGSSRPSRTAHAPGLVIVHRQFELCHHRRDRRPHIRRPHIRCRGLAEDNTVICVIDNHRAKAPGIAQRLPTEDKPTQGEDARKRRDRRTALSQEPVGPSALSKTARALAERILPPRSSVSSVGISSTPTDPALIRLRLYPSRMRRAKRVIRSA